MEPPELDVVVVGAGFSGLYLLHRLRAMGMSAKAIDAASDVGGTWYWNRYPGARCDIESMQYAYQFSDALQQDWVWTERYSSQPEILRYAQHVAERFDLRRDILFDRRVVSAHYDEEARHWTLETESGETVSARHCVMATGCLSTPNKPPFPGIEDFRGPVYHTGLWPHEPVDFTGQRVAIIGTGSSAIQSIPIIARQAEHLTVFQRTPNYAVPAHNAPLDPEVQAAIKADYAGLRARARMTPPCIAMRYNPGSALDVSSEDRAREYEARWQEGGFSFLGAYGDLLFNQEVNETAAAFVRGKIRSIVNDAKVAERLCPTNPFGAKRLCVDTGYYATYNRENVTLVDLNKTPIETITTDAIRTTEKSYPIDALVCATGFDAMTGTLLRIDIRGRGGLNLADRWHEGPRNYLGLAMAGFPNLFTVTGPFSPSVLTNMLPSIEQHVEWITDCLDYMEQRGLTRVEATEEAEADWLAHCAEVAAPSLRPTASSWYVGSNIAGKPQIFMPYLGGFPRYVKICEEVVAKGYKGFALS